MLLHVRRQQAVSAAKLCDIRLSPVSAQNVNEKEKVDNFLFFLLLLLIAFLTLRDVNGSLNSRLCNDLKLKTNITQSSSVIG